MRNQLLDVLGLIARKPDGSEALPFVQILQYKEKELVEQTVVCRCSEERSEGIVRIIRKIDAVGALVFLEVELAICTKHHRMKSAVSSNCEHVMI